MSYQEFLESVRHYFASSLGGKFHVEINEVAKNNGTNLNGLSISNGTSAVTPNIYLNEFYDKYISGITMDDILEMIWIMYQKATAVEKTGRLQLNLNFAYQKDRIILRLINYEKNKDSLLKMPYIRFLDLAITFHSIVASGQGELATLPISNELMQLWNVTATELFQYGLLNMKQQLPFCMKPMHDMFKQLIRTDFNEVSEHGDVPEELMTDLFQILEELAQETQENNGIEMYVISNELGLYGACCMLYEEEFKKFAEYIGEDLYILPSSIHELIAIPYDNELEPSDLISMVQDVNETELASEDILSYQVYYYSIENQAFQIITSTEYE